jgi:hypothetical protein
VLAGGEVEAKKKWEWTIVTYFWAADMSVDVAIDNVPVIGEDIRAKDLIDKVEVVVPVHVEGRRGKGGGFLDLSYMELADKLSVPDGPSIDADLAQILLEAGGFYRLKGGDSGLDVLFGVRVFEVDLDMDIAAPPPDDLQTRVDVSETLTDGFVGLRHSGPIGKKWSYGVRGDIGAGDTDLALNGILRFVYQFGQTGKYSLSLGWRYQKFELEEEDDGTRVDTDIIMSGPGVGFLMRF